MLKSLPTLLVVTTVALAIWIVAEAESVRSEEFRSVIAVDPGDSAGFMARGDPSFFWPDSFVVSAEGSAGALEALRRELERGVTLAPGRGLRREVGQSVVDLRSALQSIEAIDKTGAIIAGVQPPTVAVEIAEHMSRQVQVALVRDGLSLETDPVIAPATVTITGPSSFIEMLTSESRALVRLRESDLRPLVPGRAELISGLRVELPPEIPSQEFWSSEPVNPRTVDVTVTLRAQVTSFTIPSVTVLLAVAPVDYNDWDVIVANDNRYLSNVVVEGPSDIIGQYERGERRVEAFVRLTYEDMERGVREGTLSREAEFGPLPVGVRASSEDMTVELTVQKRIVPAPTPEDPPSDADPAP